MAAEILEITDSVRGLSVASLGFWSGILWWFVWCFPFYGGRYCDGDVVGGINRLSEVSGRKYIYVLQRALKW